MAFADLNDDMKLAEEMLKYVIHYTLEKAPKEMEFFVQLSIRLIRSLKSRIKPLSLVMSPTQRQSRF